MMPVKPSTPIAHARSVVCLTLTLLVSPVAAQVTSMLWGADGEAWDPATSILDDFTDVGYMSGDVAIPTNWPVGTVVTDYGAVPNDEISDVEAFREAISNCPPHHAILVPEGTYWITDVLQVTNQNDFVLRGEDMYNSVLYFPTNMSILYPEEETGWRYSVIAPPAVWWMQHGTNMNIENISIEFSEQRMGWDGGDEHFNHDGRPAIHYQGVRDSWIRNVYIRNANDGVILTGCRRVTAMNIVLDQYQERPGDGENTVGHHGLVVRGSRYCLYHNCFITGRWQHDLITADVDVHNVYSRITAVDPQIDHHAMGAESNLWTEIDTGEGLRVWEQNISNPLRDTYWNIHETTGTGNTNLIYYSDPSRQDIMVGMDSSFYQPTSTGSNWWHETLDPNALVPQNIYLAQLAKVGKPIPGPLIDFDIYPANPNVFVAMDDTYIDLVALTNNFSWSGMPTRRSGSMQMKYGNVHDRQPWMKFDLTGSAFTRVESATLSVFCQQSPRPSTEVGAYGFSNDNWSQDTLTWSNRPAGTSTLLSSAMVTSNNVMTNYEWDVTGFVNDALTNGGDGVVTIYLKDLNRTDAAMIWRTHEGAVWHPTITLIPDQTPPAAPTNLTATAGDGSVTLAWDDNTEDDLAGYTVYRSNTAGNYAGIASGLTSNSYVDTEVTNHTAYFYVVTAVDSNDNESTTSRVVAAIPAPSTNGAPAFLTDPVAETNALDGTPYTATLADDASDPESDPMIFFKMSGPDWLSVASDGSLDGTPGWTDAGTNRFTVQVIAAGGSDTAELEIVVEVDTVTPPAAPTGLAAVAGVGSVSLSWDANTEQDLAGYTMYRSTTSSNGYAAVGMALGTNSFYDAAVENGTTYYYAVTATDIHGNESAYSHEVAGTPAATVSILVTATQNGGFDGHATQDVSQRLQLRNAFGYGNDDYAYLRFAVDAVNNTIGGVAVGDITAATLNLTVVNALNYGIDVYALEDNADPGAGFLTETTWTDSNLTDTNAPHGNTDIGASGWATRIAVTNGSVASLPSALAIELDVTAFQSLIADSSNDEITLLLSGPKNFNGYVASLDNTAGYGVPTLEIRGEPILTGYGPWADAYGVGAGANDFDADGLSNLFEYSVDGNPTNQLDQGTPPILFRSGSRYLYVHPRRSDDTNITYTVETTTNLVSGNWTNEGTTVSGLNLTGGTLDFVTNEVDTAVSNMFLRLKVEQ